MLYIYIVLSIYRVFSLAFRIVVLRVRVQIL